MIWFRKKATGARSPHPELRSALLCEESLAALADRPNDDPDTPLARCHAAQASLQVGDRAQARRQLHDLLALPMLSTPWQLQAWSCLRELDELPAPASGAVVRGVVVETGAPDGFDTVAGWEDRTATLLRSDGAVLAHPMPDGALDDHIAALLESGRAVVQHTHPHRGQPEDPPGPGHASIRVLTFVGTHVGVGALTVLDRDAVGGAVIRAAQALRTALLQGAAQAR
jgi:hypothetical protein